MSRLVSYSSDEDETNSSDSDIGNEEKGNKEQKSHKTSSKAHISQSCNKLDSHKPDLLDVADNDVEQSTTANENSLFLAKAREKFEYLKRKKDGMREQDLACSHFDKRKKKQAYMRNEPRLKLKRQKYLKTDLSGNKRAEDSVNLYKETLDNLQFQDFELHNDYDPHGRKKSKIEKELDEAIANSDFSLAEEISDEMSKRTLAKSVAGAFKAKKYLSTQKEMDERRNKKKKKLYWSFDQKQRWEVKGNM